MSGSFRVRRRHRGAETFERLSIPPDYGRSRRLRRQREARRLVGVGGSPERRVVRLAPQAARAWRRMQTAAAGDGITLFALSGFRSIGRQALIIRRKVSAGATLADVLRVVAAPGYSEHHTGRAVDIGSPEDLQLDEHFAQTTAFRWLSRHARKFGFRLSYPKRNPHQIAYEPWHWCWRRRR